MYPTWKIQGDVEAILRRVEGLKICNLMRSGLRNLEREEADKYTKSSGIGQITEICVKGTATEDLKTEITHGRGI